MIKTVVREHHWSVDQIGRMFADDFDYLGIAFWAEDVHECYKKK